MTLRQLTVVALLLPLAPAAAQELEPPAYMVVAGSPELQQAVAPLVGIRGEELGSSSTWILQDDERGDLLRIRTGVHERRPKFLLLVGDVDLIPTFTVADAATDRPYGDFDGDGFPEASIGRLPFNDPAVVKRIVARILRYEGRREGALWRRSVSLVAGEGRFSPAIDAMIENMFARIVSQNIGLGFDVDLTYANPRSRYCFPPERFAERVVDRLNEGALVFAYVGHGQKRSVDRLTVGQGRAKKAYDVLGSQHVAGLRRAPTPAVFLAIACWTGYYEGAKPCIGEELMASPGGPVGFFGATRVSHPVHNALLAKELVRELVHEPGTVRLGPALDRARKAMVKGRGPQDTIRTQILMLANAFVGKEQLEKDMPRHVDMYNLLGDPALRLARPDAALTFEAPANATAGQPLQIRGRTPARYRAVTVAFETARTDSARPNARPGESARERYARANDKVLAQQIVPVKGGAFEATFDVPADLPAGTYRLKGFAQDEGGCAAGGLRFKLGDRP